LKNPLDKKGPACAGALVEGRYIKRSGGEPEAPAIKGGESDHQIRCTCRPVQKPVPQTPPSRAA